MAIELSLYKGIQSGILRANGYNLTFVHRDSYSLVDMFKALNLFNSETYLQIQKHISFDVSKYVSKDLPKLKDLDISKKNYGDLIKFKCSFCSKDDVREFSELIKLKQHKCACGFRFNIISKS